jgi:hypothetical protein
MTNDDEAARHAKAESLRQKIAGLKSGQKRREVTDDDSEAENSGSEHKRDDEAAPLDESPREFVQRKMRELDRGKPGGKASDT